MGGARGEAWARNNRATKASRRGGSCSLALTAICCPIESAGIGKSTEDVIRQASQPSPEVCLCCFSGLLWPGRQRIGMVPSGKVYAAMSEAGICGSTTGGLWAKPTHRIATAHNMRSTLANSDAVAFIQSIPHHDHYGAWQCLAMRQFGQSQDSFHRKVERLKINRICCIFPSW